MKTWLTPLVDAAPPPRPRLASQRPAIASTPRFGLDARLRRARAHRGRVVVEKGGKEGGNGRRKRQSEKEREGKRAYQVKASLNYYQEEDEIKIKKFTNYI